MSLDPKLTYHHVGHTVDVCDACERFARDASLSENDTTLLLTAALLHDIGFLFRYENNEEVAAEEATKILPGFDYNVGSIEQIQKMIMATSAVVKPENQLEQLICDADLDYLGRNDFFAISHLLKYEQELRGQIISIQLWYIEEIAFLEKHKYYTLQAKQLRESKKQENIAEIKFLLKI